MVTKPATPTELLIAVFAKSPADVELILQEVAAAVEAERAAIRAAAEGLEYFPNAVGAHTVGSVVVRRDAVLSLLDAREPVL